MKLNLPLIVTAILSLAWPQATYAQTATNSTSSTAPVPAGGAKSTSTQAAQSVPAPSGSTTSAAPAKAANQTDSTSIQLSTVVVTASGVGEELGTVPQTVRYFTQDEVQQSNAHNISDFFAQQSLGFAGNISPGHTLFTMRGATSGSVQGWDDQSEIAVLINGRPAGTANIGKLSAYDVDHIEVLRGPNTVLYGSGAIGGVINLITKDGVNDPGSDIQGTFASFDHYTGTAESGGTIGKDFDYYAEITGATSGNYGTGSGSIGTEPNTAYQQGNIDLNFGWNINDLNRVDFTARHDGFYNAGHPGVTYSLTDYDNRYNTSAEIKYTGSNIDHDVSWSDHLYYVNDVDEFHWSQNPLLGGVAASFPGFAAGLPGITKDLDIRRENKIGDKISTVYKPIESNSLVTGIDLDYTWVDNSRERDAAPGYGVFPSPPFPPTVGPTFAGLFPLNLPPTEYNSETYNGALYAEDSQKFFNDKLNLRVGARYDYINEKLLSTDNQTASFNSKVKESNSFVYEGGGTYAATPWLTLRSSIGTGFRAADPTELYASTQQGNGVVIRGNPHLQNEASLGWEFGGHVEKGPLSFDLVYFDSTIWHHIQQLPVGSAITSTTYQWINVPVEETSGLEWQASYDFAQLAEWKGYQLEPYVTGDYDFEYNDRGVNSLTNDHIIGTPEYQTTFGLRGGKFGKWSADFYAIVLGANYEAPLTQNVPGGTTPSGAIVVAPIASSITLNTTESYVINKYVSLFFGVNNILNKNYDPNFFALNNSPTSVAATDKPGSVSGDGISAVGREFFGGFKVSF